MASDRPSGTRPARRCRNTRLWAKVFSTIAYVGSPGTLRYGMIPAGMHLCHRYDERRCINPDHHFVGTHQDNMRDKRRARAERGLAILKGECGLPADVRPEELTPMRLFLRGVEITDRVLVRPFITGVAAPARRRALFPLASCLVQSRPHGRPRRPRRSCGHLWYADRASAQPEGFPCLRPRLDLGQRHALRAKLETPVHLLAEDEQVGGAQGFGQVAAPQFGVNGHPGLLSGHHHSTALLVATIVRLRSAQDPLPFRRVWRVRISEGNGMYNDVSDLDGALERGKLGGRFLRLELADRLAPKSTPFRVPSGWGSPSTSGSLRRG